MNWAIRALITSASWGLTYVAAENALKVVDKKFYILSSSFFNFIFWCIFFFFSFCIGNKIETLKLDAPTPFFWLILAYSSSLIGNYFCVSAIDGKNAVSASIVEISYPLFCVLFSIILNGKSNLNLGSFFGMIIVLIGMFIFILNQK